LRAGSEAWLEGAVATQPVMVVQAMPQHEAAAAAWMAPVLARAEEVGALWSRALAHAAAGALVDLGRLAVLAPEKAGQVARLLGRGPGTACGGRLGLSAARTASSLR
jgi:hypothetical protein